MKHWFLHPIRSFKLVRLGYCPKHVIDKKWDKNNPWYGIHCKVCKEEKEFKEEAFINFCIAQNKYQQQKNLDKLSKD